LTNAFVLVSANIKILFLIPFAIPKLSDIIWF
jgi:hypothetical protein